MITSTYLYNAGSYTQLKNALNLQPGFSMEFAQENGFADTWHVAALAEDSLIPETRSPPTPWKALLYSW